jgi:hypothetical protein
MSKKEKVIIFEGEDKFVKPRHHSYDINTGKAEFVGVDGPGKGDERDPSSNITRPGTGSQFDQTVTSNLRDGGAIVGMPTLGEPDYCNKLRNFITTRGGGSATPDQIMGAHEMFKLNCMEADPTTTTSTTTSTTTVAPKSDTNIIAPAVPVTPVVPVIPFIPSSTNLGIRPVGGGGGGGSDEQAPVEKKKSYWWLLLVALGIYLVAKKNKD